MPRRLRLLRLCAAVLSAAGKIRYARQQSIGQGWKLGQKDNHGGWDWPGQLDQAGFVSALPNGDICVCDSRNHRVHIFPSDVPPSYRARPAELPGYRMLGGNFGWKPDQLYRPSGCTSDGKVLYVVDSYNHRLKTLNLTTGHTLATSTSVYGTRPNELKFPQGLHLSDGLLYVADTRNHRVATFDLDLKFVFTFGSRGTGPGELSFPVGMAVLRARQEVYVVDAGNDRIQVFSLRGKFIRSIGKSGNESGEFDFPSGISLAHGRLYVSEFHGKRVQVLTPFGQALQTLKLEGVGSLSSIDVDIPHDRIFITDHDHHRVHVVAVRGVDNSTSSTDIKTQGFQPPASAVRKGKNKKAGRTSAKSAGSTRGGGKLGGAKRQGRSIVAKGGAS